MQYYVVVCTFAHANVIKQNVENDITILKHIRSNLNDAGSYKKNMIHNSSLLV